MRAYWVDHEWSLSSVLPGTRHFNPEFDERSRGSIREPFKRWLEQMVEDFGLSRGGFFGAMSDGGGDVRWMMKDGLGLEWEWCVAHMTNVATKSAFGTEP